MLVEERLAIAKCTEMNAGLRLIRADVWTLAHKVTK